MNERINEAPKLSKHEEDLQWVRGIWTEAAEALAKKLTLKDKALNGEEGVTYTVTDAMEIIADEINTRIDMYESPINIGPIINDKTPKTEAEMAKDKEKADYLKGTRYHQTEQVAVSVLNERIGDMNTFENAAPRSESELDLETLKNRLSELNAEADRLRKLIIESGENIDVELGSEAYIDHGYTARLREEIEPEIKEIEERLKNADDQDSAQRNLNI